MEQREQLAVSAPARAAEQQPQQRTLPSTADILARGVTLAQVQQAVRRLRPHIEQEQAG